MPPTDEANNSQVRSLQDYLSTLRRRWVHVLVPLICVPVVAFLASTSQQTVYEAEADVLLSRSNLANMLTGASDPAYAQTDASIVQTQVELARSPVVARRTLRARELEDRSVEQFLADSAVEPAGTSLFLSFRARDPDPGMAQALAVTYARQYTSYRRQIDTRTLRQAREDVASSRQQAQRRNAGQSIIASLEEREQQLATLEALQTSNATVTQVPSAATQVAPTPTRNAGLGLLLGLLFGVAAAFARDILDKRIRSEDQASELLPVPLLGRLPRPPSPGTVAVADEPTGAYAEAISTIKANLAFASIDSHVRVLALTSSVAGEGKSTTSANLAVALAQDGRRVVLVDLDMRRPTIAALFGFNNRAGLTNVALGTASLDGALVEVPLESASHANGRSAAGSLRILPTGPLPPLPSHFLSSPSMADTIASLADDADIVLLDVPPVVPVSDVLVMSSFIDAFVAVVRLGHLERQELRETVRLLGGTRTKLLGYVVTGFRPDRRAGYYGYGAYGASDRSSAGSRRPAKKSALPARS